MDNRPIGVFDSGVGGLTVVRELMKNLPNEQLVYFADTLRFPYGSKKKSDIIEYSRQIVKFLLTKNVKAIVIACNTICCNSYEELCSEFDMTFIDLLSPTASVFTSNGSSRSFGIIATEATISSGVYERFVKKSNPLINVYSKACPLFAPLVEEGWYDNEVAELTAKIYLSELMHKNIDTLILGCTHYPILTKCIQKVCRGVNIIDPAQYSVHELSKIITETEALREDPMRPHHEFFVSSNSNNFDKSYENIMGTSVSSSQVDIEAYR